MPCHWTLAFTRGFEAQFNKAYLDKKGEDEAAKALTEAEHEVILILLFKSGKASFFEKLNNNSDVPRDLFEKEKTGYLPNQKMGHGLVLRDESEWFTHQELERLYQSVDRQTLPVGYDDARSLGF